ncbi:GNAT family N-acetyltransferase [Actinoplanes bogorensis]|uniref:GNAT family N-acetyltransferase n=1 Tax=Paractinoplanes bogorensis TaxID=1610840 RepID=A0ABS5YKV7_9ACTN|nr:GNAT family N-acetyltransferase [Actinoplanes bogorensis]MBU2664067.1 GNAT family N-acetyltransferase [Actinoplanes bogorensis]
MPVLTTDRLTLREWRDDDLDMLAALNADPEVMRYIRDGSVLTREESAERLQKMMRDWSENGFGLFPVEVRATGELIGWAGLAVPLFLPQVLPAVEIGWRLSRDAWGHGYATEAAAAALEFAFDEVGLDRLISIRHVDNHRSARVMEKLGLTPSFTTTAPDGGRPLVVHARSNDSPVLDHLTGTSRPASPPGRSAD